MTLNFVTVTGSFPGQSGTVTFTPPAEITDLTGTVLVQGPAVQSYILSGGNFTTAPLLATDNIGLLPPSWTWLVTVALTGARPYSYPVLIPAATGTTATLSSLPVSPSGGGGTEGFSSPMTTLGDMIYGGTSGAAGRVAGNTSATKQFLTGTGTGSAAAAPVWTGVTLADLPAGTERLVASQTLASPAANITFSAIPQGFNALRLLAIGRSANAAESDYWFVRINGDAGSNYDTQEVYGQNVTSAALPRNATVGWWIANPSFGDMPGASATAGIAGILEVEIPAYSGTTFCKTAFWRSGFTDAATSTTDQFTSTMITTWRNTAAITSLSILLPSASNLVTGTVAYLYAT